MLISAIVTAARRKLLETTASFWSDDELIEHANAAVRDLWRAITDTHQDYFFTIDETVTMDANAGTLSNVPAGVSIVLGIEPLVQSSYPHLNFFPRRYTHADMVGARNQEARDASQAGKTYYSITGAGAPIAAPTIYVAPKVSSQIPLRLIYVPVCATLVAASTNPIPGESDDAIIAYVIAHALGKEREDRKPDPDWIAKYGTEKENILVFVTPRQDDEPDVAEAVFEGYTD